MNTLWVVIVSVLCAWNSAGADSSRVRPLDPASRAAYERGQRDSSTFRALLDELQGSDLIVHVVTTTGLPSTVAGTTRFVADRGGVRYVRIDLSIALTSKARVAVLGHELRHAGEIAGSSAQSSGEVDALYRVIGIRAVALPEGFETSEAEAAGRLVWTELGRRQARRRAVE